MCWTPLRVLHCNLGKSWSGCLRGQMFVRRPNSNGLPLAAAWWCQWRGPHRARCFRTTPPRIWLHRVELSLSSSVPPCALMFDLIASDGGTTSVGCRRPHTCMAHDTRRWHLPVAASISSHVLDILEVMVMRDPFLPLSQTCALTGFLGASSR